MVIPHPRMTKLDEKKTILALEWYCFVLAASLQLIMKIMFILFLYYMYSITSVSCM